ncbi:MAG: hypothetical protein P8Y44_13400 [Acidobacteriota bacterium]|jgi:hypothetical protein
MHVAFLALLPALHILVAVLCILGAAANLKKNPGLAGFFALLAAASVTVAVWFSISVLHAG